MLIDYLNTTLDDAVASSKNGTALKIAKTAKKGLPVVLVANSAYTGDRIVSVKIQDSPDDTTWTDLITFPTVDKDTGNEVFVRRIHTQERYIRGVSTYTAGTGGGDCAILVFAGIGLMGT